MAENVIQIKRSDSTDTPDSLEYGELAYSFSSNSLFIGTSSNTVLKIAGAEQFAYLNVEPGVLTNTAALVANSSGYLDQIKVGTLFADSLEANALSIVSTITGLTLANVTIDSLLTPLATKDGGTGLTSFVDKGVFFASNTSTMSQVTGANGQVLQITNDSPTFGDLDGGTF